jgi:hypothetical protein
MKAAEATAKAIEMEASMQKLLGEKGLIGQKPAFAVEKNTAINKYLNSVVDDSKRAEALVNGTFSRMEDAIVNFTKTGKLNFSDLWSFMAEEYLRNMIRMAEKDLLTNSAGNFIGFGGIVSGLSSWLGSFGSHATGLDYVPYDGYPALLHKGEKVQTAVQARGGDSKALHIDASVSIGQVGSNVSRAEVYAAAAQAAAQSRESLMRTLRQQQVAA